MTWIDFMRVYDNTIDNREADYLLWEQTAFPCCDTKTTVKQLIRAIRAKNNKIIRCEMCGWKEPFHQPKCLAIS